MKRGAALGACAVLRWLLAGCLLLALAPAGAVELRQAQLQLPSQPEWRSVDLPQTWSVQQSPKDAHAQYRLHFTLEQAPQAMWALRIDRLSTVHRVWLNGQLVHASSPLDARQGRLRALPAYLALPPALLRAGGNDLQLELQFDTRAGLSTVHVGPDAELRGPWRLRRWADTTVPLALNIGGGALAAFMLLLWLRRSQERATGLFGALWLIASVRNWAYFAPSSPLPSWLNDWLYFTAQVASVALLGLFALALSQEGRPRMRRLCLGCLVGLPLVALLAVPLEAFATLRLWVYPLLMAAALASLLVLRRALMSQPSAARIALLGGMALLVGAAAHDYAYLHGWRDITDFFWLPWAVPLAMTSYAVMLLSRLVQGMARSEDLSQRLEQRVAERTRDLAAANRAKTRFLASASHDLRQPVAAIGLLVGMVRERLHAQPGAQPVLPMLDMLGQAVVSLEDLLRGLLDLSRLQSGAVKPQVQPVRLQVILDAIAGHERPAAHARGLRLRIRASQACALSDPLLLEQILRNLVANAVRYTARGGIVLGVRRRGTRLHVQVWDSGCGIAQESLRDVFQEFVQLGNPQRDRSRGLGLGLAIVRQGADVLGHQVGVRSRPGRGSCFWIDLPAVACPPVDGDAPAALHDDPAAAPLAGWLAWVVEDEPTLRLILSQRLRLWGAQVRELADLAELGQALREAGRAPDALLTDYRLPDGHGGDVIALARQRLGAVRCIVLTGETAPDVVARIARLGAPVLHKPFNPQDLLALLRAHPSPPGVARDPGATPTAPPPPPPACASSPPGGGTPPPDGS